MSDIPKYEETEAIVSDIPVYEETTPIDLKKKEKSTIGVGGELQLPEQEIISSSKSKYSPEIKIGEPEIKFPELKYKPIESTEYLPLEERDRPPHPKLKVPEYAPLTPEQKEFKKKVEKVKTPIIINNDNEFQSISDKPDKTPEEFKGMILYSIKKTQEYNESIQKDFENKIKQEKLYGQSATGKIPEYIPKSIAVIEENIKKPYYVGTLEYIMGKGYNESIIGLAEAIHDKSFQFDPELLKQYDANWLEDAAAFTLSLVLDLPTFGLGGKFGTTSTKPVINKVIKSYTEKLIRKGIEKDISQQISKKAVEKIAIPLVSSSGALGTYDFIKDAMSQWSDPNKTFNDIDWEQSLKSGGKGYLLGIAIGGLGIGNKLISDAINKMPSGAIKETSKIGANISIFGTMNGTFLYGGALLEGEPLKNITKEDWLTSIATLGALHVTEKFRKSDKFDDSKINKEEFNVELNNYEKQILNTSDIAIFKDKDKLSKILSDEKIPQLTKAKILWANYGIQTNANFNADRLVIKDNKIEYYNENNDLLDVQEYKNIDDANSNAIVQSQYITERKNQQSYNDLSPNEKSDILNIIKTKNIDLKQLNDVLEKDILERTPEENQQVNDFYNEINKYNQQKEKISQKEKEIVTKETKPEVFLQETYEKAKKEFGITDNFVKAGYILPNGELLDFSEGKALKTLEHKEIEKIGTTKEDFIKGGAIRLTSGGKGFELSIKPTEEQISKIKDHISKNDIDFAFDLNIEGKPIPLEYKKGENIDNFIEAINARFDGKYNIKEKLKELNSVDWSKYKPEENDPYDYLPVVDYELKRQEYGKTDRGTIEDYGREASIQRTSGEIEKPGTTETTIKKEKEVQNATKKGEITESYKSEYRGDVESLQGIGENREYKPEEYGTRTEDRSRSGVSEGEARKEISWKQGNERPFEFDPNSTINEGRFRLRPPTSISDYFQKGTYKISGKQSDFISRNKFKGFSFPDGIRAIIGKTKNGIEEIQALRFNKEKWSEEKAGKWFEQNKDKFEFYKEIIPEKIKEEKIQEKEILVKSTLGDFGIALDDAKLIQLWKKYMTAKGYLPKTVFDEWIKTKGRINKQLSEVHQTAIDFKKALRESYGQTWLRTPKVTQEELIKINTALGSLKIENIESVLKDIPEPLHEPLINMRNHIDALSREMIRSGMVEGDLIAKFEENLGYYLTRTYKVHNDKKWTYENIPDDIKNKAINFIKEEFPEYTDKQIDGELKSMVYQKDGVFNWINKGKLGSKDLGILKKRKDIPIEIRDFLGEYKDPLYNYSTSVSKMANLIEKQHFLDNIKKEGMNNFLFEERNENFYVEIAAEGSATMSPLNGLYTTPEIAQAFENFGKGEPMSNLTRWYIKYLNVPVKYGKTILSPVTHARNYFSNYMFQIANGRNIFSKETKEAHKTIISELSGNTSNKFKEYYNHLVELNVIGESTRGGEVHDAIKDMTNYLEDFEKYGDNFIKKISNKTLRTVEKMYQVEDDVHKIIAFEIEKSRYLDVLKDEKQAEIKASEIVRKTMPTYSLVPPLVKSIRRVPLIGTFVSFPSEVIRTTYNTIGLAKEEIKNPETRNIGIKRISGIMTVALTTGAASITSRYLLQMNSGDDKDIRRFIPSWSKNSDIIFMSDKGNGNYTYIDLGFSDPYNYLKKPIIALLKNDDIDKSAIESLKELAKPFLGEELLASILLDIQRNKKKEGGASVYNEESSPGDQMSQKWEYLWKGIQPGVISTGEKIYQSFKNEFNEYGINTNPINEISNLFLGVKIQDINVKKSFQFKIYNTSKRLTDAFYIYNKALYNKNISKEELENERIKSENSIHNIINEINEDYKSALRLGVDKKELYPLINRLKVGAYPASDIVKSAIMTGKFKKLTQTGKTKGGLK